MQNLNERFTPTQIQLQKKGTYVCLNPQRTWNDPNRKRVTWELATKYEKKSALSKVAQCEDEIEQKF